jgi:hypothetical protein
MFACDDEQNDIGDFWQSDEDRGIEASYLYADRDLTVKGISRWYDDYEGEYYEEEFNCSFKKGWNIVYFIADNDKITTQKPSGANLKWYYYEWGGSWKSPSNNPAKLQKVRFPKSGSR